MLISKQFEACPRQLPFYKSGHLSIIHDMKKKYMFLSFILALAIEHNVNAKRGGFKWKWRNSKGVEKEGPEDESTTDTGNGVQGECDGTYPLNTTGPVSINAGSEVSCNYTFIGASNCQPLFKCETFNLEGDKGDCEDAYLLVQDAWGGVLRVCGKGELGPVKPSSKGGRDLFISVAGHAGGEVKCEGFCATGTELADVLETVKNKNIEKHCVCGVRPELEDRDEHNSDANLDDPIDPAASWVLSAAHCFANIENLQPNFFQIILHAYIVDPFLSDDADPNAKIGEPGFMKASGWNAYNLTDDDEQSIRLDIEEILVHPLFNELFDYDVALLRLSRPVDLISVDVSPICLPSVGDTSDFTGNTAIVSGWGAPEENSASTTRILQKLEVPIQNLEDCTKIMDYFLNERMLCAGNQEGGQDACKRDSGGPLIIRQSNKQWLQIGIVSWGDGCARPDRFGIYSRITDLEDWIQFQMRKSNPIWCRDTLEIEDEPEDFKL